MELRDLITGLRESSECLITERRRLRVSLPQLSDATGIQAKELKFFEETNYKNASIEKVLRIAEYLNQDWVPFHLSTHLYNGWIKSEKEWEFALALHSPIIEGGLEKLYRLRRLRNDNRVRFGEGVKYTGYTIREFLSIRKSERV